MDFSKFEELCRGDEESMKALNDFKLSMEKRSKTKADDDTKRKKRQDYLKKSAELDMLRKEYDVIVDDGDVLRRLLSRDSICNSLSKETLKEITALSKTISTRQIETRQNITDMNKELDGLRQTLTTKRSKVYDTPYGKLHVFSSLFDI